MVSDMATWDDVRRLALALPQTVEGSGRGGMLSWSVKDKTFAWERPLRKGDLQALGDAAPQGPILAARVPDLGAKEALLADNPDVYFTTPHFNGYPAVLVRLERIAPPELEELLVEAWLSRAPKGLAPEYLALSRRAGAPPHAPPERGRLRSTAPPRGCEHVFDEQGDHPARRPGRVLRLGRAAGRPLP